MQVLPAPSLPSPRRPAPCLLDRRPSAQRLLAPPAPPATRTFVPLTPIIASPRMTPPLRVLPPSSSTSAIVVTASGSSGSGSSGSSGGDYLTRGYPVWTATPPTPPPGRAVMLPPRERRQRVPSASLEDAHAAVEWRGVKRRRTMPEELVAEVAGAVKRELEEEKENKEEEKDNEREGEEEKEGRGRRRMFMLGDEEDEDEESAVSTPPVSLDAEARAGVRRYHALLELLTTEVGYVLDLRVLVSIYLAQLESITAPPPPLRPSPSALAISTLALFPHARAPDERHARPPDASALADATNTHSNTNTNHDREKPHEKLKENEKEKEKRNEPLFSPSARATIARNADALLAAHERLAHLLERALIGRGYASLFHPLHPHPPEAEDEDEDRRIAEIDAVLEIVVRVYLAEVAHLEVYDGYCPYHVDAADAIRTVQDTHPAAWDAYEARCAALAVSLSPASPAREEAEGQARRLRAHDYLIKPVQRLCKYAMLLDAAGKRDAGDVFRALVERVNRVGDRAVLARAARKVQERLVLPEVLNAEYVRELGACLLVGALEVVYAQRTRYLAAFLYVGGYVLLAKVPKGGRYEAKHWFSLRGFVLADEPEDDHAELPHAFHLYNARTHIHLAAPSTLEKHIWLLALRSALASPLPSLPLPSPNFPTSSSTSPSDETPTPPADTPLARRTSSASVKAFFTPHISRASTAARLSVDAALSDVLSESLAAARARSPPPPRRALSAFAPRRRLESLVPERRATEPPPPLPTSAPPSPNEILTRRTPQRTRSLVDNVRSLFHARSGEASPSSSLTPSPSPSLLPSPSPSPSIGSAGEKWWRRGSLRRRVQSSPDVPQDEDEPKPVMRRRSLFVSSLSSSAVGEGGGEKVQRRRSLFVSSLSAAAVGGGEGEGKVVRRRSVFGRGGVLEPGVGEQATLGRRGTLRGLLGLQRAREAGSAASSPTSVSPSVSTTS